MLTFWLALVFMIPQSQVVEQVGAAGRPAVLFGYGLLILWLATRWIPGAVYRVRQPMRWFVGFYAIAFVMSYSLGVLRGLSVQEATSTDRSLIVQLSMVSVTILALDGIPSRKRFDDLMLRLIGFAAFSAFVGLLQFFWTYDLTKYLSLPGLGLNGQEPILTIDERNGFNRVAGTTGHAIEFGSVMAIMLPIALHYLLHDVKGRRRFWLGVATFLIAMGVPMSISRTSTIAIVLISLGLAASWSSRMLVRAGVAGTIALAVLRAAVPSLLGSIKSLFTNLEDDLSYSARTSDYPIVFRFIRERPFFGRGPGTFGPPDYLLLDNEILSTTVNTGIIGLVSFVALYLAAILVLRRVVWTAPSDETRHLAMSLAVSLFVAMVVLYFADMIFFAVYSSLAFLMFGLAGRCCGCGTSRAGSTSNRVGT
ncbi:MAG: O-antigen ligase family protein [Acidimicrobiales bacterium]